MDRMSYVTWSSLVLSRLCEEGRMLIRADACGTLQAFLASLSSAR